MNVIPHTFYSGALNGRRTCYVYLPKDYEHSDRRYPVIYLLHGRGGSETDWYYKGQAVQAVEQLNASGKLRDVIVVMPNDGGYDRGTFYVDWYDGSGHFEQYIAYDLLNEIDREFRTLATRQARVIGGFSMGGYGSFMLALRHPDKFGAAASLSGVLGKPDDYPIWERARMFGPAGGPYEREYNLSWLAEQSDSYSSRPELFFNCGTEDALLDGNRYFHEWLTQLEYRHFYEEHPGEHNWEYVRTHLPEVLQFFEQYFYASMHDPVMRV